MIGSVKHRAAGLLSRASCHAPTLHARPLAVNICTHPLLFAIPAKPYLSRFLFCPAFFFA